MELRPKRPPRRLAPPPLLIAAVAAGLLGAAPGPAHAADLKLPESPTERPPGHRLTAERAIAIAGRDAKVRSERERTPKLAPTAYLKGSHRWQVSWFARGEERVQVMVADTSGAVLESWAGYQVRWRMARGYDGAFGRKVNAPYVWLPFCLLFLIPFLDPRRPFRLLHLDLLVLLGFGVSHVFFNRAEIDTSVPLAYPVLAYFLVRLAWEGFSPRERRGPLVPLIPATALALMLVFLVGFRIALNVADSNVIDVGYAGVIGADRIMDGDELYGAFPDDNEHGDTYGPFAYLAYVPFEQVLPWTGLWDDLPAAHAAAIFFDLATLLGLLVLGRRLRAGPEGRMLGLALAYGWAAFPYSLFVLETNSNDALVAMLLVLSLLVLRSAPARGAITALGGLTKFASLTLAPLLAAGTGESRRRSALVFGGTLAAVTAMLLVPWLPDGGLGEFWDRTAAHQADRGSPFSLWGLHPSLEPLQRTLQGAAVLFAAALFFVPRRRTPVQIAALGAAALVLLQLGLDHWFYLYVVWWLPLALVALFAAQRPAGAPGGGVQGAGSDRAAPRLRETSGFASA